MGRWRWLAVCRRGLRSATPEWRVRKVGGRVIFLRQAEVLLALVQALRAALVKQLLFMTIIWCVYICLVVAALLALRRSRHRPWRFEMVELVHSFLGPVLAAAILIPDTTSPYFRYRAEVFAFFWSLIMGMASGMRSVLYVPLLAASVLFHSLLTCSIDSDLPLGTLLIGVMMYFIVALFCGSMVMNQSQLLQDLQLAEQSTLEEMEASAAVLSMFCDAKVVFAGDGDTILECDQRFVHIMGKPMQGLRVSLFVEHTEEAQRQFWQFRDTLVGADVGTTPTPVTAHPINLISTSGSSVRVTLYAAGHRRRADAAARYAVGVVVNENELAGSSSVSAPQALQVKRSTFEGSCSTVGDLPCEQTPSEAPTTRTGALFRPFSVGDGADLDVPGALGQLAELGRKEHWLVEPREIELLPKALGAGGFGSVHGAKFCGAPVVVKLVQDSVKRSNLKSVASLLNELRVLRHCRHPNLVQLQGAVIDTELCRVGIILEVLPQGNLEAWITSSGASDAARFRVMVGVCRGLWFLHTRSPVITHGDLKAQNVLIATVGHSETAKVLDFGLSRMDAPENVSPYGGSLKWMAPEQLMHGARGPPTPAVDVFAFGRLLQFLIAGKHHYDGVRPFVVRQELSSGRLSPPVWSKEMRPLERSCQPLAEACLVVNAEERPPMGRLHAGLLAVPTEDFDDQHGSAGRISKESENHVPWREAVKPAAFEPPPAPRRAGRDEGQGPGWTCRYSRMRGLMGAIGEWRVEVSSASCCELHAAIWQACRDLHDLNLASCDQTAGWRQPWPHGGSVGAAGSALGSCQRCGSCVAGKVSL